VQVSGQDAKRPAPNRVVAEALSAVTLCSTRFLRLYVADAPAKALNEHEAQGRAWPCLAGNMARFNRRTTAISGEGRCRAERL